MLVSAEASTRRPEEPVSTSTLSTVWQFVVLPGSQMMTLTRGIFTSFCAGPRFTWMGTMLFAVLEPPPLSATLCAPGLALSAKFREAVSMDGVEGFRVRVTVQGATAATWLVVEQVILVMEKSIAFAPETEGLELKVSDAEPVFVKVTVMGALVTPSATGPKETLEGKLTAGAGEPPEMPPPPLPLVPPPPPQAESASRPATRSSAPGRNRNGRVAGPPSAV